MIPNSDGSGLSKILTGSCLLIEKLRTLRSSAARTARSGRVISASDHFSRLKFIITMKGDTILQTFLGSYHTGSRLFSDVW